VSLNGNVIEDVVFGWPQPVVFGRDGDVSLPVPAGAPFFARLQWRSSTSAAVEDGRGRSYTLQPDQDVRVGAGDVELHLTLVRRYALRRVGAFAPWGSMVWFAAVLATTQVTQQIELITAHRCDWFGIDCKSQDNGINGSPFTAEYLARLLRKDFAGEEVGVLDRIERPPQPVATQSFYMPAGDHGPTTNAGGAAEVAKTPERGQEDRDPVRKIAAKKPRIIATEGKGTAIEQAIASDAKDDRDADGADVKDPDQLDGDHNAEDKEGWGVRDWYDASDARVDQMAIDDTLTEAHERLRIDPDDPDALSLLSYYQYLDQDYDGASQTYQHYIKLYPESAAGYNNHALVYKRRGDYRTEQALYQVALALSPDDVTALNNLAVNLAHQGQFDDALAIMKKLETLDPGEPYADLHRAKIYAAMGEDDIALTFLRKSLEGMKALDTLHHIEFRQDIRIDPAFAKLRETRAFRTLLLEYYGEDTPVPEDAP